MPDESFLEDYSIEELIQELRERENPRLKEQPPADSGLGAEESVDLLGTIDSKALYGHIIGREKVVYGTDDRVDIFAVSDRQVHDNADSVASLWRVGDVVDNGNGTSNLMTSVFGPSRNMCPEEQFFDQPIGAFCSGFLVAPDVLATAGHCVDSSNLSNTRFVFGYRMIDANNAQTTISNDEIYRGVSLVARELSTAGSDWALVRLDRRVTNHNPLPIRRSGKIPNGQGVYVIGHPVGLPTKFADGANVRDNAPTPFFVANLDTYGGNSGSPVFNATTHEVEGILVRGETDFVSNGSCMVSLVCPSTGCRGEDCTRTTQFADRIPDVQLVVRNFGYNAGGWRVGRHPRFMADLTGDGVADVLGFGNAGAYIALNNGTGSFGAVRRVINNFGYTSGGWRTDRHPRFVTDLTGDGRADVIGFGNAGAYVSLNSGTGSFGNVTRVVDNFGYSAGGWRVDSHPRMIGDLTGNGAGDIVGFGNAGVYVAINNDNGTFGSVERVISNFGYNAGGWRVDRHPRFLADLTGDGRADIIGFGSAGVYVSLNNGDGTFGPVQRVIDNFGANAGDWRVDRHPRFLADLTGDGRADIVGFGNAGVYVSLNNGDGTFGPVRRVVDNFGYNAGGWRISRHPRLLGDLTGNGRADIVGFGNAGVYVALNKGNGTFGPVKREIDNFGYSAGGWRVSQHPRFLANLSSGTPADICGFGNAGLYLTINNGNGTF